MPRDGDSPPHPDPASLDRVPRGHRSKGGPSVSPSREAIKQAGTRSFQYLTWPYMP